MRVKVGEIDGYEVIFIPEKDVVFCKNTAIKVPVIRRMIESCYSREVCDEKSLTITKSGNSIHMGCLNTTKDNYASILRNVQHFKHSHHNEYTNCNV